MPVRFELTDKQAALVFDGLKCVAKHYQARGEDSKTAIGARMELRRMADVTTEFARDFQAAFMEQNGREIPDAEAVLFDWDRPAREARERALWQATLAALPAVMERHHDDKGCFDRAGDIAVEARRIGEVIVGLLQPKG